MNKAPKKQEIYESPRLRFININARRQCIAQSVTSTPGADGNGFEEEEG